VGFSFSCQSDEVWTFGASKLDQKRTPADGVWIKLFLLFMDASFLMNVAISPSTNPDTEV
jgi:hypothetical protein